MEQKEIERLTALFKTKIEDCPLTVRSMNCLKCVGIETIGELCKWKLVDLLKQRNIGKKSLHDIECFLSDKGLTFGMDVDSIMNPQPTPQVKENNEYWLFTIQNSDLAISNCFFDWFPSRKDLQEAANTENYAILNMTKLTKEQHKLLTKND